MAHHYQIEAIEAATSIAEQDRIIVCNGCGHEWEADKPNDCPSCGYQDTENITDRMERIAEQFGD